MALKADRVGVRPDQVDVYGRVILNSKFIYDVLKALKALVLKVWNGGTEQLLPVNTAVPVTSPVIADIDYPDVLREDQEFTYRESPTTADGVADIMSIKGNTLVWNQVAQNGNFANDSGWLMGTTVGTFSIENNQCTVTVINTGTSKWNPALNNNRGAHTPIVLGHKYFLSAEIYPAHSKTNMSLGVVRSSADYGINASADVSVTAGIWNRVSAIVTSATSKGYYQIASAMTTTNGYVDDETDIVRNAVCIDLTAMFGSGNEPATVEEFTSLFPLSYYQYNAGSLLNFNGTGIKTENADQTESDTLSLPVSIYFPTGMKSAGTVQDELTDSKAVQRVESVDLGTLTWVKAETQNEKSRFTSSGLIDSIAKPSASSDLANILCSKYETKTADQVYTGNVGIGVVRTGTLSLFDTTFEDETDPAVVKSALSGVYLNYELAEPIETDILPSE